MSNQQKDQSIADNLKKELLDMQAKRKKIEDELLLHRVVLENVGFVS